MDFKQVYKYTKDLNVLYVEDNKELLSETLDVLEDFFSLVDSAVNGQEALEKYQHYFSKNQCYYDLIITDINMPIMDGEALIKEIKQINSEQVVMVISAYNESSRLIDLIQSGINNFVLKPIAPSQLMGMLYTTCKNIISTKNESQYRQQLEELNKNLDKKVQKQAQEILFTQKISIEMIGDLIENFDDDTGKHVKRIEAYTSLILNKLPISENEKTDIRSLIPFSSLLHDIGKIYIPKEILSKPGKLSEEEFEIMKSHAKLGGIILLKANEAFKKEFNKDSYLMVASNIAQYHHEKYNGKGYPEGLVGDAIPLCARIVALVDVYDALRSVRVYKEAWSHQKATSLIEEESGKSFDPNIVEVFIQQQHLFAEAFDSI